MGIEDWNSAFEKAGTFENYPLKGFHKLWDTHGLPRLQSKFKITI